MRVSVVQMESGPDKARNVAEMLRLLEVTSNKIGHASASLDFDYLRAVRERMPVREHDVGLRA